MNVTWLGAKSFARYFGLDLPSEAEWEYACRADSVSKFNIGEHEESLDCAGWYERNSGGKVHPVGRKKPNAWGLYDMHGNTWEWCKDWFDRSYLDSLKNGVINPGGPSDGYTKTVKGGTCFDSAKRCTSAVRGGIKPEETLPVTGFRVVERNSKDENQGWIDLILTGYWLSSSEVAPGSTFVANYEILNLSKRILDFNLKLKYRTRNGLEKDVESSYVSVSNIKPGKAVLKRMGLVPVDLQNGHLDIYWKAGGGYIKDKANSGWEEEALEVCSDVFAAGMNKEVEGFSMCAVPGGDFLMGSPYFTDDFDQLPVHEVKMNGFWMSSTPVTQAQYEKVTGKSPSRFKGYVHPVECVSWYDAAVFCNELSRGAGLKPCYDPRTWYCDFNRNGFRLPTEAEWEYACRAGSTTLYNSGSSSTELEQAGWCDARNYQYSHGQNTDKVLQSTQPVGQKNPNTLGLYDMHGNVFEWCYDWYDRGYYKCDLEWINPAGPATGRAKVARGGHFASPESWCRSSYRGSFEPESRFAIVSFRVVRNAL